MSTDTDIKLMLAKTLTKEQLADLEDKFKPGTPPEKCRLCGNRKIYKYDGHGPICKKCAYGHDSRVTEPRKVVPETGRNEPCPCGSGKKYKKCCMNKPVRVQRKRTAGYKLPCNTIYVGRPTKWGNPFKVGFNDFGDAYVTLRTITDVLSLYEDLLMEQISIGKLDISELKGKNLACFCALDKPCHADILLKLANQ